MSTQIAVNCADYEPRSMDQVVEWITRVAPMSAVHVTLRSVISGHSPRKYQASLQALGCTVTARMRI